MKLLRTYGGLLAVVVLSWWAINHLFVPGFFPMHDDTQVVRVAQMTKALLDGHFPVRWVRDLGYGYGYPLFNFYAPLPYYIGAAINLSGFDALTSTKAMMVIGVLLSGAFMYLFAREFFGEVGGIVSALFYVYVPYHAVDIYVRGAVGEFWAIAFTPLAFFGLWKVSRDRKWRWVIVGSFGYAAIILSHNLTAMLVTPLLLMATLLASPKLWHRKLFIIFLGLGLSVFYWIPALLEMGYTNVASQIGGGANFRDHFVCLPQLWDSPWGFGGSAPGCTDGLSFKLGKLHFIAAVFVIASTFFLLLKRKQFNNTYHYSDKIGVIFLTTAGLFISLFFTLEGSRFIWETISAMAFLQYPWRFLTLSSFFSSFLAGASIWVFAILFEKKNNLYFFIHLTSGILLFLLLIFHARLFIPQTIIEKSAADYTSEENIAWVTSRISDEYMPRGFEKPRSKEEIVRKRVSMVNVRADKTHEFQFTVTKGEKENLLVRIAPFPSWQAFIDGKPAVYQPLNNGISIAVPRGTHTIRFSFASTTVERIANGISLVSLLLLIGGILKTRFSV